MKPDSQKVVFQSAHMSPEGVMDVSPEETLEKGASVNLIDVRRPDEYTGELGHVQGAKLITLETDFAHALETLPQDECYIFICRSGARSTRAAAMAATKGFLKCYNMQGGMIRWNALGLPTTKNG